MKDFVRYVFILFYSIYFFAVTKMSKWDFVENCDNDFLRSSCYVFTTFLNFFRVSVVRYLNKQNEDYCLH